ncbi:hypothetical protein [Hymenobacter arizonensis]|uniref:hypothetical protein n=1 Tax=Hymenobacter arizonensis TaxID=1227077 RepID=UPI00116079EA|nr:hypothetical protein [Hymenobacter arizonensis]
MKENNAIRDYRLARKICDAEMIKKFKYYRILFFYGNDKYYDSRVTDQARDSARIYAVSFAQYVGAHCCQEAPPCPSEQ